MVVGEGRRCLYCRQGEPLRIAEGGVHTGRLEPDPFHSSLKWAGTAVVAEETYSELCCCRRPLSGHWIQEYSRGSVSKVYSLCISSVRKSQRGQLLSR